ncbi:MAG: hypothetical protein SGPRY_006917, partial [Prymnesium sp.]
LLHLHAELPHVDRGRRSFSELCAKLEGAAVAPKFVQREFLGVPPSSATALRRAQALIERDVPSLRFKVGACLHVIWQGGRIKVAFNVAFIGEATLRRRLHEFCD